MERTLTHDTGLGIVVDAYAAVVSLSEVVRATPIALRQCSSRPTSWVVSE
jgi:hypothetical protein